jgi:hypothetical protein
MRIQKQNLARKNPSRNFKGLTLRNSLVVGVFVAFLSIIFFKVAIIKDKPSEKIRTWTVSKNLKLLAIFSL